MTKVGIRELKNHLSRYIHDVKRGNMIHVAEWGRVVARIVPEQAQSEEDRLWELVRSGEASWQGGKPDFPKRRVKVKGKPPSQWILENRR